MTKNKLSKKEKLLKVNTTFDELVRVSVKGNPKPKRKVNINKKGKEN